jgi:hypothetical protein
VTATNLDRAFAAHPEVYAAWAELSRAIRERMDFRRYELATAAAPRPRPVRYGHHGRRARRRGALLPVEDDRPLEVRPDASYRELDPELREALVVGRSIAEP